MDDRAKRIREEVWRWGLPVLLGVLAFGSMFGNGFVWDDQEFIVHNPALRSLWPPEYLRGCPGPGFPWLGQRPVTALSFALDYAFWKGSPWGFHLTNLLFHVLCTLGVIFLAKALFKDKGVALAAGALFAVHPGHGEAVVAFLGRSDLLATAFVLLASLAYLRSMEGERKTLFFGLSVGSFFLGCFSKETALAFLGILILIEGIRIRETGSSWKRGCLRALPFVLVAILYGAYRHHLMSGLPAHDARIGENLLTVIGNLLGTFAEYVRLFLFPLRLSPWYEAAGLSSDLWENILLGMVTFLVCIGAFILTCKWDARKALAIGWFLGGLSPVLLGWIFPLLGLRGLGGLPGPILAERWLYLPSVGGCLAGGLAFALARSRAKPSGQAGLSLVGLFILALFIWRQVSWTPVWKSEESIARAIVTTAPQSALGFFNLGNSFSKTGRADEAEAMFRQAIRLKPDYAKAHNNLGILLEKEGRVPEADQEYREAIRLKPDYAEAHTNLGNLFAGQGRADQAESEYLEAIRSSPDYPEAHYDLGTVNQERGEFVRAEAEYRQAIRLSPEYAKAHNNLGTLLARQGKLPEAEAEYRAAVSWSPGLWDASHNLAALLKFQKRNAEAVAALEAYLANDGRNRDEAEALIRQLRE